MLILPQIYVRSTDLDRTLMTAQAVLAGLYPPSGEQEWNPDIKWQPIPVHTIDPSKDVVGVVIRINFRSTCAYKQN